MVTPSDFRRFFSEAMRDQQLAVRRLKRAPTVAVAVIVTLAVGLGAAATILTALDAALLQPPPFTDPARLVHLWETRDGNTQHEPTSLLTLLDWRAQLTTTVRVEGYNSANLTVGVGDEAVMLRGGEVTPGFFRLLGVRTSAGRDFAPASQAGGEQVVLVSRRFASSSGTGPGASITVNGSRFVVIGVLPEQFTFAPLQDADVWIPVNENDVATADRTQRQFGAVARVRADVSIDAARQQLSTVAAELARIHPESMGNRGVAVVLLQDALLGNVKSVLMLLGVAVGVLLLTMTANLMLLTLTRYVERAPELSVRTALGAPPARLLRQLLAEGLVPGLAGALLAILVSQWALTRLMAEIPHGVRIGMPYFDAVGIGAPTAIGIILLALLLTVAYSLLPALLVAKVSPTGATRSVTRGRREQRMRRGLVAAQLACTVMLLIATGLLVGSVRTMLGGEFGIADPNRVHTARVSLSGDQYMVPGAQRAFFDLLLNRVRAVPGVQHVGAIDQLPGNGGGLTTLSIPGEPTASAQQPRVALRVVAGAYFGTMGIPLVRGRAFDATDRAGARPVAMVSSSFLTLLGETPETAVGRRFRLADSDTVTWELVGIVGEVQAANLDQVSPPVVYLSHRQFEENRLSLVVRGRGAGAELMEAIRAEVKALDTGVPVYATGTLGEQLRESRAVFVRRFPMLLCGVFACSALLLALVALYALASNDVHARRRELAVRLALGAPPRAMRGLVVSQGVSVAAPGILGGVLLAVPLALALRHVLVGIEASDWRVYATAAGFVFVASLLATLPAALRAGTTPPSGVLNGE